MAKSDEVERDALRKERAARIRAARAFADVDQATFAQALGVAVVTIKRMERGTRDVSLDDLYKLADLCAVPRDFMAHGWVAEVKAPNVATTDDLASMRDAILAEFNAGIFALTEALLTRDEALAVSRQALDRLRTRGENH